MPVTGNENEQAQQALLAELRVRGYRWLEGAGEDAKEEWPAEPSVLVLGMSREEATRLAVQFRQNAYVFCDEEGMLYCDIDLDAPGRRASDPHMGDLDKETFRMMVEIE